MRRPTGASMTPPGEGRDTQHNRWSVGTHRPGRDCDLASVSKQGAGGTLKRLCKMGLSGYQGPGAQDRAAEGVCQGRCSRTLAGPQCWHHGTSTCHAKFALPFSKQATEVTTPSGCFRVPHLPTLPQASPLPKQAQTSPGALPLDCP